MSSVNLLFMDDLYFTLMSKLDRALRERCRLMRRDGSRSSRYLRLAAPSWQPVSVLGRLLCWLNPDGGPGGAFLGKVGIDPKCRGCGWPRWSSSYWDWRPT